MMVLVPPVANTIPVGFSNVEVGGVAPGPKSQKYEAPVVPVFVKLTGKPAQTGAFDVNETAGAGLTTTLIVAGGLTQPFTMATTV